MENNVFNEWKYESLGNYIKVRGGKAFKSKDFKEQGVPILRISNIKNNGIDLKNCVYADPAKLQNYSNFLLENGNIVIAMSGATTGKTGTIQEKNLPLLLNQRVGVFEIQDNTIINQRFLKYVIASTYFQKILEIDAIGGAQPNISPSQIESIHIYIPPINEQQKIASILSSVDEAIEKTELILKKSEKITNSVTKKLLTSGIDHEVLKSTRLGELPNNWEVIALKELSSINMGQSPPSVDVHDYEKGIPFYQGNADFGEMNPSPRKWCDKPKKIANSNDILFSVRAPVGEMNIAIEECCIGRGLASITPREVSPSFLYYLLLFYRKDLKRAAQGSTFTAINKNDLVNLELPLPKKEEQEKITIILDTLWNKKQIELSKLNELKNLKKGLMQQLLTGKVRVPTTESEEVPQ